jgi:PAS domain S-box-containing protein
MPSADSDHMTSDELNAALSAAGIGTWMLDPVQQTIQWDAQCRRLYGSEHCAGTVAFSEALKRVLPEDQSLLAAAMDAALNPAGAEKYDERLRISLADGSLRWLHCIGQASSGSHRFCGTARDVTEEAQNREQARDSERIARVAMDNANSGYFRLHLESDRLEYSRSFARILTGNETRDLRREDFVNHILEEDRAVRAAAFRQAEQTGKLDYEVRVIWDDGSVHWMRAKGTYVRHPDGNILTGTAQDTSLEKAHGQALSAAQDNFRSIFEQAPMAIGLLRGSKHIVESANEHILTLWGKDSSVLGKSIRRALPELEDSELFGILDRVYVTGVPFEGREVRIVLEQQGMLVPAYFDFTYTPVRDGHGRISGVMVLAADVSERVFARKSIENSEARLRSIIANAPAAMGLFVGPDLVVEMPNQRFIEIVGKGADISGRPLCEVMPELLTENQPFLDILQDVYRTGRTFQTDAAMVKIVRNGVLTENYYNITYSPVTDANGEIYAILDIAIDVTELITIQKRIVEAEAMMRSAVDLAELGTWTLDLQHMSFDYSPRLRAWLGLDHLDEISLERHEGMILEDDRSYVQDSIMRAVQGGRDGVYNVEYTLINHKTGQHRNVHAIGKTFYDTAGDAVNMVGTIQDITARKLQQLALEREVQFRTEELAASNEELMVANEELADTNEALRHSNEELAQYAYVASHDLQEPLRKIRMFASMLGEEEPLSPHNDSLAQKIGQAAERMSLLIRDLLEFSRLLKSDALMRPVDLQALVNVVINDFELIVQEKRAEVHVEGLPEIEAISLQMNQLFYNLIGNALKFSRPGVVPQIRISSTKLSPEELRTYIPKPQSFSPYHIIYIEDNGIGFDRLYAEQIFEIFKRLQGREIYPGSGIGLALCRRIAGNHGGHIFAESEEGKGSRFCIVLPESQG